MQTTSTSIQKALRALRTQETLLQAQLERVRETTTHLIRIAEGHVSAKALASVRPRSGPERLSPKGRAAISRAAKKRWAEYRRNKQVQEESQGNGRASG